MKAKLFTLLLIVALLACVCAFTAEAADVTTPHCVNGHTEHTGENADCSEPIVQWKYWNDENARASITSWGGTYNDGEYKTRMDGTGNWILTEDVTLSAERTTGNGTLRIDLNGHNIIRRVTSADTSPRLFHVKDPKSTDTITPALHLTDLSTEGNAGRVYYTWDSGVTTKAASGSLIYAPSCPVVIAGRVALDGTSTGAAAILASNNFTMYNGTLKLVGGTALWVENASANVKLLGGTVNATVVLAKFGTAQISGDVSVTKLSVTSGYKVQLSDLGANAKIPVILRAGETTGVFTTTGDGATLKQYIADKKVLASDSAQLVTVKDNAMALVSASHCAMGHEAHTGESADCDLPIVAWQYWYSNDSVPTAEGNYILTQDVTLANATTISKAVAIDLNGYDITRNVTAEYPAARAFTVSSTMTITDLSTEGEPGVVKSVIAEGVTQTYTYGGIVYVSAGPFTLAGRAVLDGSNQKTTTGTGGATIQLNSNKTFNMYGGTLKGLASTGTSASALHSWGASATYNIYGGEITSVATEMAVYCGGHVNMSGGKIVNGLLLGSSATSTGNITISGDAEITGETKLVGFGTFTVEDNVKISKLTIPSGKKITVGELGNNAEICVNAEGVFTEAGTASVLQGYIDNGIVTCDDTDYIVVVESQALAVVIKPTNIKRCINGHETHVGANADCTEPIVEWRYWDATTAAEYGYTGGDKGDHTTKMTGTGNFILIDDITLSAQRTTGNGTLRIDLNGHNIIRKVDADATTSNARAFYVYDPTTTDTITPALAITDLSTEGEAGCVSLSYDEGVTTQVSSGAAIVNVTGGPFTLAGRAVIDGTVSNKVAIYATKNVTVYGGTVKHNGTGLYTNSTAMTLKLLGGNFPCAVNLVGFKETNVAGDVTIKKLIVPEGKKITMGTLGSNASIKVDADGQFTTTGDAAAYQSYIDSGKIAVVTAGLPLYVKDNAIWVGIKRCINGHTDHTGIDCAEPIVEWKYWNNESAKASYASWNGQYADGDYKVKMDGTGNWILSEDLTLNITRSTGNGALLIDLNGHNVTRIIDEDGELVRAFSVADPNKTDSIAPYLAITDLSTTGAAGTVKVQIAEDITPEYSYGIAVYAGEGKFILAGRAVLDGSNISTTNTSGGATVQVNGSKTFVMYGGEIKGLASTGTSSAAINGWGGSIIQIHGGLVSAVSTEQAVYAGGEFTMTGGKIVNGVQIGTSSTATGVVTVTDDAQITGTMKIYGCTSTTIGGTASIEKLAFNTGFTKADAVVIESDYAGDVLLAWPEAVNYGETLGAPITVEAGYAEAATIQVVGPNAKALPTIYGDGVLYVPAVAAVTPSGETWLASPDQLTEGYLKLYAKTTLTATDDLIVDINGQEATVNAPAGKTVTLYNTKNDDFGTADLGKATVTGGATVNTYVTNPVTGYRYIAVKNSDGSYTAHRIHAKLHQVSIRPREVGVYYSVEITCDDTLEELVTNYGVAVSLVSMPDASFMSLTPRSDILYTYISNNGDFASGQYHGAMLKGIMTTDEISDGQPTNADRAAMPVYANAYVVLAGDGLDQDVVLMADEDNIGKTTTDADWNEKTGIAMSLTQIMEMVNDAEKFDKLTNQAKASVQNFYKEWKDAANWAFATIENWVKPE